MCFVAWNLLHILVVLGMRRRTDLLRYLLGFFPMNLCEASKIYALLHILPGLSESKYTLAENYHEGYS